MSLGSQNIAWILEGNIKDYDAMLGVMTEMVAAVKPEAGTLNYEWVVSEDKKTLIVYERYLDLPSTMVHLGTFNTFAPKFFEVFETTMFTVLCELPPEMKEAVSGLNPRYMTPIGGFPIGGARD